ncbi:unnamed protein product [Durusdinium trenchii]|uniref:Uncharacterized protein n=1 Tax=Durusdinium trenchii TaxID=1381693 RepID=A0ABP0RZN4_9DINO
MALRLEAIAKVESRQFWNGFWMLLVCGLNEVDMCAAMVGRASEHMDVTTQENLLEFFPPQSPDAVVLCNVIEPYSPEARRLLFSHIMEFLSLKGRLIVVIAIGQAGLGTEFESVLDLVFPTAVVLAIQLELRFALDLT